MLRTQAVVVLSLLAANVSAQDHFHMTVDSVPTPGLSQTVIRAGYLGSESAFSISDGRLLYNGEIAVVQIDDQIPSGTFAGYYGSQQIVLTSDFYFSTGRLDGGDFNFEIVGVERLAGPDSRVVWVHTTGPGVFSLQADSQGATQPERSYNVGIGGHQHAQLHFVEFEGLYDISFVAWVGNGLYLPSEPVTVRVRAGEPAECLADTNHDGIVSPADFSAWVAAFNTQAPECDQNGDGVCSPADFSAWVANYNTGC
ncbi:MAG: GC-type dockerin domain-anchored protein [Phycisphaerales bacterium JB058]